MFSISSLIHKDQPVLVELDPPSLQRVKEGIFLVKLIGEAEVSSRKCQLYSQMAINQKIKDFFQQEAFLIDKTKKLLEQYYQSMKKE